MVNKKKIYVLNKQGKKVAEFYSTDNYNSYLSEEQRRNLIIAPTINLESNGLSTLSFQMLHTSQKWQDIKNPENVFECNNRRYTALNEESIQYQSEIVVVELVETWYLLKKKFVQAYNVDTSIEAIDEHTVKILPKATKSLYVNGTRYSDSEVKDITGARMPRGSAGYALWAILQGSGWKLGVCDVIADNFNASKDFGTFNVESDMKNVLENIQAVRDLYGGILHFDSINNLVHLRDESKSSDFNKWKGYQVRKNKNLSELPQITWNNNIITRLYPLGNGNLNIKRVNNNKNYIDNFSYTTEIYEGYLQNANIYDTNDTGGQQTLKQWAERELEKLCKPRKKITYNIVDISSVKGFEFETFDINDIVKCYYVDDKDGNEKFEYLRIIKLSYDYFNRTSESTIEVGDKILNEVEIYYQTYKAVSNSAQTDNNGNLSGWDISIEIPESFWEVTGTGFGYSSLNNITRLYADHITQNTQAVAEVRVYADETFTTIESYTTFAKQTDERFTQSNTKITQVSDALSAQIDLEASHYQETKQSIIDSYASLKLYADNTFSTIESFTSFQKETEDNFKKSETSIKQVSTLLDAQISLEARHYREVSGNVEELNDSLASFQAYANKNYATTSQLSSYATKDEVTSQITKSEASIKTYASNNFASISLQTKVNDLYSRISVTSSGISVYSGSSGVFITSTRIDLIYGSLRFNSSRVGTTEIDGKDVLYLA